MLKYLYLFFLLNIAMPTILLAQDQNIQVQLSWWTDTTNHPELKPFVNLYTNYINSAPDSIYDNPNWNKREKILYKDFDLSRNSIFQGTLTAQAIFSSFIPVLLKIEKKDTVYQLSSLLKAKAHLGPQYTSYDPLAIMKYAVVKENGKWKMANILPYETSNWNKYQQDYITFYAPTAGINNKLAIQNSVKFCDSICDHYNLKKSDPFSVYTVNGTHELGQLLGYEYYIYGNAEGKSINSIVLSGNSSPYYPHEFVHQIWPKNDKRNRLLDEGIATWLGGSMNQNYKVISMDFSSRAIEKVDGNFTDLLKDHTLSFYAQGAILCDLIHHYYGTKKLKLLLEKDTSDDEKLLQAILEITKWNLSTFNKNWKCYLENISDG
ncbi:hypothetical protein [Owenweeksia hongkongensis]|uniref:hypothetical protein n=1 Tax=Owenweeksia hongkongensis TaxID=253245 RepID=UPI003A9397F4